MDMNGLSGDFLVCPCKKKSKDEILSFIRENDIHDLKTLRKKYDVGNKCGGCAEDLESLIKIAWQH